MWFEMLKSRNVPRGKLFEIKANEKVILWCPISIKSKFFIN
jgi:hypothetical protein